MIPKKLKLKTEDFKKLYTNLYNGEFLNIKVHYVDIIKQRAVPKTKTNDKEEREKQNEIKSKYGIIITKKINKSAVQRNKIKRILK